MQHRVQRQCAGEAERGIVSMRRRKPATQLLAIGFDIANWSNRAVPPRSPYLIWMIVVSRKVLIGIFGLFGLLGAEPS
eukprot:3478399-Prymnesium_polylepis.3